jgi:hypothetical protein
MKKMTKDIGYDFYYYFSIFELKNNLQGGNFDQKVMKKRNNKIK